MIIAYRIDLRVSAKLTPRRTPLAPCLTPDRVHPAPGAACPVRYPPTMAETPIGIDETHDPALMSWVESANDPATDFPIQNLPFCRVLREEGGHSHVDIGVAIGDQVFLIGHALEAGLFDDWEELESVQTFLEESFQGVTFSDGPEFRRLLRSRLSRLLRADQPAGQKRRRARETCLVPIAEAQFLNPVEGLNYTDFYASIHHATTVGSMFRPDNPLLPNYKWIPIGYHGRASSLVVSGTPVIRPRGQTKADDSPSPPAFGPCRMLDYELEVGMLIDDMNLLGSPVPIDEAESYILGLCLVNDWSARDVQKWEYQPLGPFLAKNFATTLSPFIVTLEALAPFRCPAMRRPEGDPAPLPYLFGEADQQRGGFDITLEAHLSTQMMRDKGLPPVRLSRGSFRDMYWTFAQLIAHHTSNGCNLVPGDVIASGTVSGSDPGSRGCLLELTWQGRGPDGKPLARKPIELPTGETRLFLEDGDEVTLRGSCERPGFRRIGFGDCRGAVEPARADAPGQ